MTSHEVTKNDSGFTCYKILTSHSILIHSQNTIVQLCEKNIPEMITDTVYSTYN